MSRNWTETERFPTREERDKRYDSLSPDKLHRIRATTQESGKIIWLLHHSPKKNTLRGQP